MRPGPRPGLSFSRGAIKLRRCGEGGVQKAALDNRISRLSGERHAPLSMFTALFRISSHTDDTSKEKPRLYSCAGLSD